MGDAPIGYGTIDNGINPNSQIKKWDVSHFIWGAVMTADHRAALRGRDVKEGENSRIGELFWNNTLS
jgi:hypothetical protein